jgi:hypothetical protein
MVEKTYLKEALVDLGFQVEEGNLQIRGFGGRKVHVELRVSTGADSYDIGFKAGTDGYEILTDWWGVRGVNQKTFIPKLSQRYAYRAAKDKLASQGFDLATEETRADGQIHLVLRRMA